MDISPQQIVEIIFVLIFGAIFGSFATMASHRLPLDEDLIFKPSSCPTCKHRLGFFDLFPIFSWLFSRGKCRHCKAPVSCRYPLTELAVSLVFLLVYCKFGFTVTGFSLAALGLFLIIMIVVDLEHMIIPDILQILMFITGIIYRYSIGSELSEYFSGALFGLIFSLALRYGFWLIKKREGLGMGDVKFFAVAGLFLGIEAFFPFLFLSGIIGIFSALMWKKLGKGDEFPFGPALAVSLFICLIAPEYTINVIYGAH